MNMKIKIELSIPLLIEAEVTEDNLRLENYQLVFSEESIKSQCTKFLESSNWEI